MPKKTSTSEPAPIAELRKELAKAEQRVAEKKAALADAIKDAKGGK